tara:strand:- start:37 stop:417 length:381 start_codon:yes stop_codon:yes gene_type:complete
MTDTSWTSNLGQFTGSTTFYRWGFFPSILTEGAKYLAENAGAYWLFDTIEGHIRDEAVIPVEGNKDFTVAKFNVKDNAGILELSDGNDNVYAKQTIGYTDFPLGSMETWAIKNEHGHWTHMLPSEY